MTDLTPGRLEAVRAWWQDVLDDLDPDTTTFALTMSRGMAEQTRDAIRPSVCPSCDEPWDTRHDEAEGCPDDD